MIKEIEHIFAFLFLVGGSVGLAIYVCIALKERKVYWRNFISDPWIERNARPITFWFAISNYCVLAAGFAFVYISGITY
jgi:hypothetical protein